MSHKESKDDVTSSLPTMPHHLIASEDEMKVVASNLPERSLTCLHILGLPFTIAPHLTKQPHSPGHSRVPQHLHHAHTSSEQKDPIQRASSPAPRSHHYGPLCSGWLSLQKTAGKWKRMWCEYADGQITYRDDESSRKAKGQVAVTYIEAEVNPFKPQPNPNNTPPQLPVSPTGQRQASHNAQLLAPTPTATPQQLKEQQQMLQQSSEDALLPASPQLTTSVSSPLVPSTTTRAQPATPNRPTPIATHINGTPTGNGAVHSPRDDGLTDTLTRLALAPAPPQLAPSNSSNASPPSPSPVTFFSTPAASHHSSNLTSASKFDELYYAYLDSLDHPFTFKVYAPARVYYFRADTTEMRDNFVKTIRTHLLSSQLDNNPLFTKKHLASLAIASCLHEQFMLQLDRYNQLVKALAKMTMEDELPITSTRKEKSGVLCMETMSDGVVKWRDYYFVLFEGALFYYKDSKSTTPTGFITLRYATLTIDVSAIFRADFVFHVVTPLRTIACRTKHAVALAEWISALEATLAAHSIRGKDGGDKRGGGGRERIGSFGGLGMERQISGSSGGGGVVNTLTAAAGLGDRERSMSDNGTLYNAGGMSFVAGGERDKARSNAVLQNISKFIADIQSFNSLIANSTGLEGFRKFLNEERDRRSTLALDFYLATNEYIAVCTQVANAAGSSSSSSSPLAVSAADVASLGESIQSRFFTPNSVDTLLPYLPATLTSPFVTPLPASAYTTSLFDPLRKALSSLLTSDYLDFKRTPDYDALSAALSNSSSSLHHSDDRHVEPFDPASLQLFLLKVKGIKRSKEIKFPKKEQLWTIGRDKSNKLVIEDSRVSRSHARVEYTDSGCVYIDLGSSCLPESDTRVLTDKGFQYLGEIEEREQRGESVRYACYDASAQSIVYCEGDLKYAAPPERWVDFTHAATRRLWDATSNDYDSTVEANKTAANRLTLRTTPDHDMYVQPCSQTGTCTPGKESYYPPADTPPHKIAAQELVPSFECECVAKKRKCTHGYSHYRMYTGAPTGLSSISRTVDEKEQEALRHDTLQEGGGAVRRVSQQLKNPRRAMSAVSVAQSPAPSATSSGVAETGIHSRTASGVASSGPRSSPSSASRNSTDKSASPTSFDSVCRSLGLTTPVHADAFLELFGYWLGEGSMSHDNFTASGQSGSDAVLFVPCKDRDREYVRTLLGRLGLERGQHYTSSETTKRLKVSVTDRRWFRFFNNEFGVKYRNSRRYNKKEALFKQGMHSSQRRPWKGPPVSRQRVASESPASFTRSLSTTSRSCSRSTSGRSRASSDTSSYSSGTGVGVGLYCMERDPAIVSCIGCGTDACELMCDMCVHFAHEKRKAADWEDDWEDPPSDNDMVYLCESSVSVCSASDDSSSDEDEASLWVKREEKEEEDEPMPDQPMKDEPKDEPMEEVPADVIVVSSDDDDEEKKDEEKEELLDEEVDPVRSAKWLPDWALFGLDVRQLRLVIEGVRQADGHSAANAAQLKRLAAGDSVMEGSRRICTSGLRFRDQLVQACLHAGYSAYFTLNTRAGETRGFDAVPSDQHIYTEEEMKEALCLDPKRKFAPVRGKHDNWWVCYSEKLSAMLPAQDICFNGSSSPSRTREKKLYSGGWVAVHAEDGRVQQAKSQSKLGALLGVDQSVICIGNKTGYKVLGVWSILSQKQYDEQKSGAGSQPAAVAVPIPTQAADLYDEQRDGRVWCVKVKHDDHLIFVQRAHRNEKGVVTKVGRTMIVGNCGSKLNGKPVLRAQLKAGDVIELGQSTLIFQVKPKKRFRLFGGE